MLNVNLFQFGGKKDLLWAPGGETPKDTVSPKVENPDGDKSDFTKKENRDKLYVKASNTINKLAARPDKASKDNAVDLKYKLDTAKTFEKMGMEDLKQQSAKNLNEKLNSIVNPLSDADAKVLLSTLDKENKKVLTALKANTDGSTTVVLQEDKISPLTGNAKADRDKALAEAKSFGMIGLLKPNEAPVETVTATLIQAPKPEPVLSKVPASEVPNAIRVVARNYAVSNPGFSGERYVQGSDGSMWKAKIKAQEGDRNGTTAWEKVTKTA